MQTHMNSGVNYQAAQSMQPTIAAPSWARLGSEGSLKRALANRGEPTRHEFTLNSRSSVYLLSSGSEYSKSVVSGFPTESRVRKAFERLRDKWRHETRFVSSFQDMILNKAYQQIIGLGPAVVPFLLQDLCSGPQHWFWALEMITGANPVPEANAGNVRSMTDCWLQWGREQNVID